MANAEDAARLRVLAEDLERLEQEFPRSILMEVIADGSEPAFQYLWPESPGIYQKLNSAAGRMQRLLTPFGVRIPAGRYAWLGLAEWFMASRPIHAEGNCRESLAGIFSELAAAVREIMATIDQPEPVKPARSGGLRAMSVGAKFPRPKDRSVNEHIEWVMKQHPPSVGWKIREWHEATGMSTGAISESENWKAVMSIQTGVRFKSNKRRE